MSDPHAEVQALQNICLRAARKLLDWEMESLADQIRQGVKPADLVLPIAAQKKLVAAVSTALAATGIVGVYTARNQIYKASHAAFSAYERVPEPIEEGGLHYPQSGLDWYDDYSLRLVGVHQAGALERAQAVVSDSIARGDAQAEVIRALAEVFPRFSTSRLENIVRTETAKVFEQAKWQEYDAEPEIVGYEFVAILDGRTSDVCEERHGKTFPKAAIEGNLPPLHFQCRSTVIPIFSWDAEADGFQWQPIPPGAPQPLDGFGTTSMEIPEPDKKQRRMIRRIGRG